MPEGKETFITDGETPEDIYQYAIGWAKKRGQDGRSVTISELQKSAKLGYEKAARILERMEAEGVVGPPRGREGREGLKQTPQQTTPLGPESARVVVTSTTEVGQIFRPKFIQ